MYVEELREGEVNAGHDRLACYESCGDALVVSEAKRALTGAGARVLFYASLLYIVLRNRVQTEFWWWDRVDEVLSFAMIRKFHFCINRSRFAKTNDVLVPCSHHFWWPFLILGAVPFPADVPHWMQLGVGRVVTLNEPFKSLVSTSLYQVSCGSKLVVNLWRSLRPIQPYSSIWPQLRHLNHCEEGVVVLLIYNPLDQFLQAFNIDHLLTPTRDHLFAPSCSDICLAVEFIHSQYQIHSLTFLPYRFVYPSWSAGGKFFYCFKFSITHSSCT